MANKEPSRDKPKEKSRDEKDLDSFVAANTQEFDLQVADSVDEVASRIAPQGEDLAGTLAGLPALASTERQVTLRRAEHVNVEMEALWWAISVHSTRISFPRYADFLARACDDRPKRHDGSSARARARVPDSFRQVPGAEMYQYLKMATEAFLILNCGITPTDTGATVTFTMDIPSDRELEKGKSDDDDLLARGVDRLGGTRELTYGEARNLLTTFLGQPSNNYLEMALESAFPGGVVDVKGCPLALGSMTLDAPCLLELIWSYWMEEGMLNQSIAAITRRFQNVRRAGRGLDPLRELALDPLRPLSAFLWGYLQDEPSRLSVLRRAYEYDHQYGLTLYGRAVPGLRPADSRVRFLEAFHNLLRQAAAFYREDNDTTVIADAFPVLNSIREVHLLLSEGAHNQFRDLPWQARAEMLLQQWLLARPEMRDFLRGRAMVAYPEPWMGAVDAMKRLQGWTDTSVRYFRDLAVAGERILLSIRYANWHDAEQDDARAWLRYWRDDVQRYVHAYHTATGVMLSDEVVDVRSRGDARYLQPAHHLRNRLLASRRAARQLR